MNTREMINNWPSDETWCETEVEAKGAHALGKFQRPCRD
jgi:hypothetical protein